MDKLVLFEIPFDEAERAKKFYSEMFGWKIITLSEDNSYFRIIAAKTKGNEAMGQSVEKGAINGGLQKRGGRCMMPTFVIEVKDIDGTIDKIKKNGGKIVVDKEGMGDMGFYAQFDDPEGNRMGIFQPVKK